MGIGALRKRITLQSETSSPDGAGGYTIGWADSVSVWAAIHPMSGREVFTAGHIESHVTHQFLMRYAPNITADMRISYQGRFFKILFILNQDENNIFLEIFASEGGAV